MASTSDLQGDDGAAPVRLHLALVHHPCVDRQGREYTTALTNVDLHDIARSGRTYGAETLFVVTPITLQQRMVGEVVRHWTEGEGAHRNDRRASAMCRVEAAGSLEDAIAAIAARDGARPLVAVTSAQMPHPDLDWPGMRDRLAQPGPPLLLVFGTGWGLAPRVLENADLRLPALYADRALAGGDGYNHLSVRAAAAIALDRLRGAR